MCVCVHLTEFEHYPLNLHIGTSVTFGGLMSTNQLVLETMSVPDGFVTNFMRNTPLVVAQYMYANRDRRLMVFLALVITQFIYPAPR